jgi:hypothetical protein
LLKAVVVAEVDTMMRHLVPNMVALVVVAAAAADTQTVWQIHGVAEMVL